MEDSEIIRLYCNRDEQAVEETEKKYGSYCFSIAKNILGKEEDARECLKDMLPQTLSTKSGQKMFHRNLQKNISLKE